jgi:hypothetical protein
LLRLPAFGLDLGWVRCVSRVAAWPRLRLCPCRRVCPCRRDGAFRGHPRVTATDIRRRAWPVTLDLCLALWRRRWSGRVLELLADGGLARLVMVVLIPQSQLLIRAGIALA